MNKIRRYISESYNELLHKVTWPTWDELQRSTSVVIIATAIVTIVVWVMDLISSSVLQSFYKLFR